MTDLSHSHVGNTQSQPRRALMCQFHDLSFIKHTQEWLAIVAHETDIFIGIERMS